MNQLSAVGIALTAGSLGALLIWGLRGQVSVPAATLWAFVGWMLTLVGWFVGARLAERAQRQMFLHQLINSAREQLVKEIRHEQDWVGGLSQLAFNCQLGMDMREFRSLDPHQEQSFWLQENAKGRQKLWPERGAGYTLVKILEEYELLFPQTKYVRAQLGFFAQERIATPFAAMLTDIMDDGRRTAAITAMQATLSTNSDYSALLG